MSFGVGIAKLLNERNNIPQQFSVLGTVISLKPLKVSIYDGAYILDETTDYVCQSLRTIKGTIKISPFSDSSGDSHNVDHTFEITRDLKAGDTVLCIPTENSRYIIVDKVV